MKLARQDKKTPESRQSGRFWFVLFAALFLASLPTLGLADDAAAPLAPSLQPFCLYSVICHTEAAWPFRKSRSQEKRNLVDSFNEIPTKIRMIATLKAKAQDRDQLIEFLNKIASNEALVCGPKKVEFTESNLADVQADPRYQFVYFKTYEYEKLSEVASYSIISKITQLHDRVLQLAQEGMMRCERIQEVLKKSLPSCSPTP